MREIDKVLDSNEKVFWEGKPKFWPYVLRTIVPSFIFGLIWMAFLAPFIFIGVFLPLSAQNAAVETSNNGARFFSLFFIGWNLFLLPFLLIGLWLLIGTPIYVWIGHKHIYYAITNKRVIIQKGIIGRDFEYIDFDKITNAEVNVGFWDKTIGQDSGSILISSAGTISYGKHGPVSRPYYLANIPNPYDVFKFFKKVSHAVKTDIEFPNQYRPKTNPGYGTEYNPHNR
ncbi:PH domain-containing protein [Candidatus Pacearchaeota archaeon]|nr:PH domain-containing protein [Candidatus Pacearchaeota archaeon]